MTSESCGGLPREYRIIYNKEVVSIEKSRRRCRPRRRRRPRSAVLPKIQKEKQESKKKLTDRRAPPADV